MNIVLINPPNCGRSIPEEEYGISSIKLIFRGEPFALETLTGNLDGHDLRLLDLKADPESFEELLAQDLRPDIIGFTGVSCEANTIIKLAEQIRTQKEQSTIVVGGHHASTDPLFFNREPIDYIVVGLGKLSFRELVDAIKTGEDPTNIPGIIRTRPGSHPIYSKRKYSTKDLVDHRAPLYSLVERYRDQYIMSGVGNKVGFVSTAFGCSHHCLFCSIPTITGNQYLSHSTAAIIRDIRLLKEIPLIRFVDANTFGDVTMAKILAEELIKMDVKKKIVADVRADTVIHHPDLFRLWRQAGLDAVVIGFEEVDNNRLKLMNKKTTLATNIEALSILAEIGVRVIGDFIISPDYSHEDFARLGEFIEDSTIELAIPSILTPIPGTPLYKKYEQALEITDLDYYTFSNTVLPTRLDKKTFYSLYARLMQHIHRHIGET